MQISNMKLIEQDNKLELSARLDDFHLWLRFPNDVRVMASIEPFLASGLMPAVAQGGELTIAPEFPISSTLREQASSQVWARWEGA